MISKKLAMNYLIEIIILLFELFVEIKKMI
jgi:hypothetical protein